MDKFKSRKFVTAIVTAIILACNAIFDWGISTPEALAVIIPICAFIAGEAWVDAKAVKR